MLVVKSVALELVFDAGAEVAESPVWDARRRRLWWVDLLRGELHAYDIGAGPRPPIILDHTLGFVAPSADGALVAGTQSGFGRVQGERFELLASVEADQTERRMNDGKCDPQGRLWGGTMNEKTRRRGCLYRLDPGRPVARVHDDLCVPNGLAWSANSECMWTVDTDRSAIIAWQFDPELGAPVERLRTISIEPGVGQPDGLTIDEDDCIWVALWGGSRVRRYAPDGDLMGEILVPSSLVTSVTFGGEDLDELYVTTARYRLSPEQLAQEPHAGAIFRCNPGVHGRPPDAYGA